MIRFHDLRHSHATMLYSARIYRKVASKRLGHSDIGSTIDAYSHVMPNLQRDAAHALELRILGAG